MFDKNMGQTDRAIRAVLGVLALIAFFTVSGAWAWLFAVIGVVLLATAAMGFCPPYKLLGLSTRKSG